MALTMALSGGFMFVTPGLTGLNAAAHAAAPAELPSVEAVFENCVKAVGGQDAIDKIKTLHVKSDMSMMGMQIKLEQMWAREGGRLVKMNMPMGEMHMGTNGKTPWMKTPMGYQLAGADEAKQMNSQSGMFMFMIDPKTFAEDELGKLEVVGEEEFAGKKCVKLHYVDDEGDEGDVFFDTESGLPVGFANNASDGSKGTMLLSDWKEIDGVKFFHLISMEMEPAPGSPMSRPGPDGKPAKTTGEIKVSTLEVNTLNDDTFKLPAEVEQLAKDAEATKSDAPTDTASEIKLEDLTPEQQKEATKLIEGMRRVPEGMRADTIRQLESSLPTMEEGMRKYMQYVVQELKKG